MVVDSNPSSPAGHNLLVWGDLRSLPLGRYKEPRDNKVERNQGLEEEQIGIAYQPIRLSFSCFGICPLCPYKTRKESRIIAGIY
jgi:hypothetical protein